MKKRSFSEHIPEKQKLKKLKKDNNGTPDPPEQTKLSKEKLKKEEWEKRNGPQR